MEFCKKYIYIVLVVLSAFLGSCIENNIPYPVEVLVIDEILGDGFTMDAPDYENRVITLQLDEITDVRNVNITSIKHSENATLSQSLIGVFDMRYPLKVALSLYQDYDWTIVAKRNISRSFKVEGQIGSEEIDEESFTIHTSVSKSTDLSKIKVLDLKLGPKGITSISPSADELVSFISYRVVDVNYYEEKERWRLYIVPTDVVIVFDKCDVWATTAWLSASGETADKYGFKYRKSGDEEWIEVLNEDITVDGGSFYTQILGLTADTDYEFIAYSGDSESSVESKRSEIEVPLENGSFENWFKAPKPWYPYLENGIKYWGTGNPGATTLGDDYNLTTPSEKRPGSSGEKSANLQSRNVLVKFAAGNLFVGEYVGTRGTNGIIGWGQPFNVRPTALRGWMKYNCGTIDKIGTKPPGVDIVLNKTKDQGFIFIALGTWTPEEYGVTSKEPGVVLGTKDTPIIIDTRDQGTFFKTNTKDVIAYGELVIAETVGDWTQFTIPLNYNTTSVIPTNIVIVCSASRYGDYFTGSTTSQMSLDDFELIY